MMTNAIDPADVTVLDDVERASLLLHEDRRRLVDALRERPDSASGLARRLGDSRQRLNHHLRALEDGGLIELAEERRKGNCVERVMRVVARRFVVDPGSAEVLPETWLDAGDTFSATYLIALAARSIREVGDLLERARRDGKRLATASVDSTVRLASPAATAAFTEELARAVAEVVARHHDPCPESRPLRVTATVHPGPDDTPKDEEEER